MNVLCRDDDFVQLDRFCHGKSKRVIVNLVIHVFLLSFSYAKYSVLYYLCLVFFYVRSVTVRTVSHALTQLRTLCMFACLYTLLGVGIMYLQNSLRPLLKCSPTCLVRWSMTFGDIYPHYDCYYPHRRVQTKCPTTQEFSISIPHLQKKKKLNRKCEETLAFCKLELSIGKLFSKFWFINNLSIIQYQ